MDGYDGAACLKSGGCAVRSAVLPYRGRVDKSGLLSGFVRAVMQAGIDERVIGVDGDVRAYPEAAKACKLRVGRVKAGRVPASPEWETGFVAVLCHLIGGAKRDLVLVTNGDELPSGVALRNPESGGRAGDYFLESGRDTTPDAISILAWMDTFWLWRPALEPYFDLGAYRRIMDGADSPFFCEELERGRGRVAEHGAVEDLALPVHVASVIDRFGGVYPYIFHFLSYFILRAWSIASCASPSGLCCPVTQQSRIPHSTRRNLRPCATRGCSTKGRSTLEGLYGFNPATGTMTIILVYATDSRHSTRPIQYPTAQKFFGVSMGNVTSVPWSPCGTGERSNAVNGNGAAVWDMTGGAGQYYPLARACLGTVKHNTTRGYATAGQTLAVSVPRGSTRAQHDEGTHP